ncbi:MAG: hypothetical protein J1F39_04655, partial [Clostridiales bacterium]|nr:hypothetical protein [Clostridiales bacterium]
LQASIFGLYVTLAACAIGAKAVRESRAQSGCLFLLYVMILHGLFCVVADSEQAHKIKCFEVF